MQRHSLTIPLTILVGGLVMIISMLLAPIRPLAAPLQQETNPTAYVPPYPNPDGSPGGSQPSATAAPTATVQTNRTAVSTTPTALPPSPAATRAPIQPSVAPTEEPTPVFTEEMTPTAELSPTPSVPFCIPGTPLQITGTGPANAGYVLLFNERAVSGGTVKRDGTFATELIVGKEAPGEYRVVVEVRGSREVLTSLTCRIPVLPTPIPTQGPSSRYPANPPVPTP